MRGRCWRRCTCRSSEVPWSRQIARQYEAKSASRGRARLQAEVRQPDRSRRAGHDRQHTRSPCDQSGARPGAPMTIALLMDRCGVRTAFLVSGDSLVAHSSHTAPLTRTISRSNFPLGDLLRCRPLHVPLVAAGRALVRQRLDVITVSDGFGVGATVALRAVGLTFIRSLVRGWHS